MIDLRYKGLPSAIECGGRLLRLKTDFRLWIEFERVLREKQVAWWGVLEEPPENDEWVPGALEFLESKNVRPVYPNSGGERMFDFVLDGDYIVASFWQAYGIDLTSIDYMHWHVFKALFNGLPKDTKMAEIIGYCSWEPSRKKYEDSMRELKNAWRLRDPATEEAKRDALEWARDFFGD